MASANCVVRLLEGKSFCIFVIFLAGSYVSGKTLLLPFGAEEGDSYLHPNDDESSGSIQISFNFPFFDHNHGSLFVNTNGVLSFLVEVSQFTPSPFPLDGDRRLVAVFWGDVDIRHGGNVSYRELHRAASSEGLFVRADSIIRQAFIGHSRFLASWMFIATWNEVPFYGAFGEALQIRNTFQALLVTNGKHAFAIYNYEEIRWTTGTASGGNSSNGLGGTQAQVGFNAGDGFNFFVVPESRTDAIVDIDKDSNVGTRGRFVFRIDNSDIVDSSCNTDGTGSLTIFPVYSSMLGGDIIRMSGPCLNETSSIMCRFAGVNVTGQVVSNTTAICVSPPVFQIGRVSLKMSTNNGESFDFSGVFTYLSPEDVSPLVTRQEANDWYKQESLTVTWDTESLQDYVDFVRVSVYSYDENLTTGEVKLYLVNCSSQMVPYSNGEFSFSRPNPPEGVQYEVGAIRVSQYSQHEDTDLELALPGLWSDVHNLHWLYPVSNHSAWCQDWLNDEGSDVNFLQVTEPCPCTQTQAQFNFNMFSNDPSCNSVEGCESFRPGAVECVRAERPSSSGGGQECCYGEDGNILNVAQTTGGGFAQRRHHRGVTPFQTAGHVPLLSHWMSDLLPREHCCLYSNQTMCDAYVSVRPSQTCENYRAPVIAISTGDPHLTTLDGKKYTFNGVGEYTMLEACNGSFVFQARMTVLQSGGAATVITALAAIESGRSDQIHVEVSERRGIDVWYRNMRSDSTWLMLHIDETQIRQVDLQGVIVIFKKANDTVKAVQVNFECGASFIVSTTAGLLNVMTALREELKGRTRGLYGNWNGEENDDFERPDGTVLSTDATVQEIHYEFGQQWQIKPENSLFRYPAGKSPSDYSNEAFVPFFWSMSDPIDNRVLNLCGNDTQCAFDFIVTGNENIAMATKEVVENFGIAVESAAIVICGSLGIPPNCTKEVSRSSVGGVASFICNDGYTLQGKSELMCEENGTWSGEVPTCVLVTCDSVTEPANGRMVVSGNNVGGVASFTCEKGYDLEGERELQCLENGTWSGEIPLCVPVTCDSIMEPTNGKKNVSHSHVGGVASFTCNEGYTLHGQDKLVCHENGTWTGEVPNCLADHDISNEPTTPANTSVTCDSVTEPTNGKKNVSHNHVGGVASFTCNEGYTLHGQGKLVCRENGTWTGKVPNCLADHEPTTPADTSGLSGWQLILVICLCCVVSIVLIVAIAKVVLTKRASRTYSLKSDANLIITSVREQPHGVDQTTSM